MPGLAPLLKPGHVVLLGEMHGTNESPQFLSDALCVALQNGHSVTVGLELPFSETERADVFLESSGDAEAEQRLLKGNFGEKRLFALNVAHGGGQAWVCFGSSPSDCGIKQIGGKDREGQGVVLFAAPDGKAYHGHYHVGRLTASPPAVGSFEDH